MNVMDSFSTSRPICCFYKAHHIQYHLFYANQIPFPLQFYLVYSFSDLLTADIRSCELRLCANDFRSVRPSLTGNLLCITETCYCLHDLSSVIVATGIRLFLSDL